MIQSMGCQQGEGGGIIESLGCKEGGGKKFDKKKIIESIESMGCQERGGEKILRKNH